MATRKTKRLPTPRELEIIEAARTVDFHILARKRELERATEVADEAKQDAIDAFIRAHNALVKATQAAPKGEWTADVEAATEARNEALEDLINAECGFRAAIRAWGALPASAYERPNSWGNAA